MIPPPRRRVVITGFGLISPLGNSADSLWSRLVQGTSGVRKIERFPADALPSPYGAECREFTGAAEDFGPLEKAMQRQIKKSIKLMCRGIQMGVAAAQLAMTHAALTPGAYAPERTGVVYGCEYMMTEPEEFIDGVRNCLDAEGRFHFEKWAESGLGKVDPLWLLKYLPNMPASHVAIFNDLRGPNNSITLREASSNLAIGEGYLTIERGHADIIVAGSTGTRLHPVKTSMAFGQEQIASGDDPTKLCRPFDRDRTGSVVGEGAGAIILEELSRAQARNATIWGEVVGYGSSCVVSRDGKPDSMTANLRAIRHSLLTSRLSPQQIGHVHAQGSGDPVADAKEAQAIHQVFSDRAEPVPVVAAQGHFGNLGAGTGIVELIASLLALRAGKLFRTLNHETPDPSCPVQVTKTSDVPSGDSFINLNSTGQGNAAAIAVQSLR